jgi:hypothetical protein
MDAGELRAVSLLSDKVARVGACRRETSLHSTWRISCSDHAVAAHRHGSGLGGHQDGGRCGGEGHAAEEYVLSRLPPVARAASWAGHARGSGQSRRCKPSSWRSRACGTWAAAGTASTTAASWDLGSGARTWFGGCAPRRRQREDLGGGGAPGKRRYANLGSGGARTWAATMKPPGRC